ncbi:MAG TPA: GAF domain-containing protein, partial [Cyanophyceae cyanobacterium]
MSDLQAFDYGYQVGGTIAADSPVYVERLADSELLATLESGKFCYVFNSRQMGKSSLRVQTIRRLQDAEIACAAIDLTEIVSPDITRSEFYGSITYTLADTFHLFDWIGDFDTWWCEYESLPPLQRLARFLKEVLLKHPSLISKNIVIFVDEVDSILRLPFSVNDFFSLIRACHNNRADQPEYNRLTFAILGVASPSDLIRDEKNSPPFNFGQAIELNGFQFHEAEPIAEGLKVKSKHHHQLLEAVLSWTGGQPFLTQKLCKLIIDSEESPPKGGEAKWVEKLVRSRILENWESQDEPEHLRTVRDRLLRSSDRSVQLLKLYQKIVPSPQSLQFATDQEQVIADDSPEQMELRLSGLVVKQEGKLKVRNRIYESVFNRTWVDKILADIDPEQPPSDAEFLNILADLERKLLVAQLTNVAEGTYSEQFLYEVLRKITLQIGDLLNADRATIFLLNEEKTELWSIVAENEGGEFLDIQVRLGEGLAGQVAQTKTIINIPKNVYQDSRSSLVKAYDKKYTYRTYNVLVIPILNDVKDIIAVIQLLNKKIKDSSKNQIDKHGFTQLDQERLARFIPSIQRILESCQSCYRATKKLRATAALAEATRSLDKSSLDTKEILQRVMDAAKKLMNADRSTLWLMDRDRGDLWTEIPGLGELRCEIGVGFAGQVAQSREPMIIPFDLYDHHNAGKAKETDKETGYRTCSILCMPVLNPDGELLGVTQLLNKRKVGEFPDYNPADWPKAPEQFKASFDENDRQSMQVFNERAGVILQYARTHETVKQLAQIKPKEVVHNTLAMLSNVMGDQSEESLYSALYNILEFLSLSISKLLKADQTSIFLLNPEHHEFISLVCTDKSTRPEEIRIPADQGIAGELFIFKSTKAVNRKGNLCKKYPSLIQSINHQLIDYPIYSNLFFSVVNQQGNTVAIIELLNKLKSTNNLQVPLSQRIDNQGFTQADEELLEERADSILPILEGFQSFYREIRTLQGQRAIDALGSAISAVTQSSGSAKDILQRAMEAAKKLTNADRSTLWLMDRDRG